MQQFHEVIIIPKMMTANNNEEITWKFNKLRFRVKNARMNIIKLNFANVCNIGKSNWHARPSKTQRIHQTMNNKIGSIFTKRLLFDFVDFVLFWHTQRMLGVWERNKEEKNFINQCHFGSSLLRIRKRQNHKEPK